MFALYLVLLSALASIVFAELPIEDIPGVTSTSTITITITSTFFGSIETDLHEELLLSSVHEPSSSFHNASSGSYYVPQSTLYSSTRMVPFGNQTSTLSTSRSLSSTYQDLKSSPSEHLILHSEKTADPESDSEDSEEFISSGHKLKIGFLTMMLGTALCVLV